ncbi:MAG: hypothetical protein K2P81_06610 [Bacteriovoracaceae bacterium]|nr:hypothetical protein [Bacteriovoracaceae bacterium]
MVILSALLLVFSFSAQAAEPDIYDAYNAIFGVSSESGNIAVQSVPSDPELLQLTDGIDGQLEATDTQSDCFNGVPSPLSDLVKQLVQDVKDIVTDDLMEEVDAPQSVVNKAIAKSKELACAEIMLFVQVNKINADVNCIKRPQVIPPIHMQAIKFPGLAEYKSQIEEQIESYKKQLEQNPQNFTADSKIRSLTKDLNCLVNADFANFNCRYMHEKMFSRGKSSVQIEIQDRSGKWYEYKKLQTDFFSGKPGPKTQKGDLQTPEARFKLNSVNPTSNYFSAVHINYEAWNERNELLGDLNPTGVNKGGDIMLHGHAGSVGCLDMGNRGAPYVTALVDLSLKGGKVPEIDIFPTDMDSGVDEISTWPGYQQNAKFWAELKKRYWEKHGAKVNRSLKSVDEMIEEE